MTAVTLSSKCYVTVCVGCGLLHDVSRRDQLTCSPACRVRAHRDGSLKRLRRVAAEFKTSPELMQFASATELLRPDLAPAIMSGERNYEDIMPDLHSAYMALIMRLARASEEQPA